MLEIIKNRINEWKACEKLVMSKEMRLAMLQDYLFDLWKLQELNGDLPEEFEGMQ